VYSISGLFLEVIFRVQLWCHSMIFGKIADCIWMLFGVEGPRMCSVGRGADHLTVRGNLGGGYEVAHCDQWGICGLAV